MYNQPIYLDKGYRKLLYKTGNIFFVPPKKFYKTRDIVLFFSVTIHIFWRNRDIVLYTTGDIFYFLQKTTDTIFYNRLGIIFVFLKVTPHKLQNGIAKFYFFYDGIAILLMCCYRCL